MGTRAEHTVDSQPAAAVFTYTVILREEINEDVVQRRNGHKSGNCVQLYTLTEKWRFIRNPGRVLRAPPIPHAER